jgi:oxygen-dependent protoporphyrinogen oxidase
VAAAGPETKLDAVVVGGGIAGLAAAWDLRNRNIRVLEASDRLGGRIRSAGRDPYWLNLGAHVFSGPGSATGRLADDVGVEMAPVPGRLAALELNGKLVAGGRPELFPLRLPLEPGERAALARIGARLRLGVLRYQRAAAPRDGETPEQTRARLLRFEDGRSFAEWAGRLPGVVDSMLRATVTRSTAEPEEISAGQGIGYFALVWSAGGGLSRNVVGGAGRLVEGIAAELEGRVELGAVVEAVEPDGGGVTVRYRPAGGEPVELRAGHAVVATKAFEAAELVSGLPGDTVAALRGLPYGPTVVMAILTGERGPMPWDGMYALATPQRSFNMLFNVANVVHSRPGHVRTGGSLMVYRSAHGARELLELADDRVEQRFLDDLYAIYPAARGLVRETQLLKLPRMLPYPAPGRAALQPALDRPLGRIHLAGDYLGGVYTDTAIASGQRAARSVRAALQRDGGAVTPAAAG